jgi:hypothetical protein
VKSDNQVFDGPLLDLRGFPRRGPKERPIILTPKQIAQLARTVRRVPEVMVKVSGGASSVAGAVAHLRYVDRQGELEIETDEGRPVQGQGSERLLATDWDLEMLATENAKPYRGKAGRQASKLVHNVVFSMPQGTPPDKLLEAVRRFAREQFALQHRYAFVLHTDQKHPHVHLIVKVQSERGQRLNIRKATLREWRSRFAEQLRAQGVAANATERAVRGQTRGAFKDPIYRAIQRGASRHLQARLLRIADQLRQGLTPPSGQAELARTREAVVSGWQSTVDALVAAGQGALAAQVQEFVRHMPPALSTDAQLALQLRQATRSRARAQEPRTR